MIFAALIFYIVKNTQIQIRLIAREKNCQNRYFPALAIPSWRLILQPFLTFPVGFYQSSFFSSTITGESAAFFFTDSIPFMQPASAL